jgi:hypothetical protein
MIQSWVRFSPKKQHPKTIDWYSPVYILAECRQSCTCRHRWQIPWKVIHLWTGNDCDTERWINWVPLTSENPPVHRHCLLTTTRLFSSLWEIISLNVIQLILLQCQKWYQTTSNITSYNVHLFWIHNIIFQSPTISNSISKPPSF